MSSASAESRSSGDPPARTPWRARIALACGATVLALAVAEAGLRAADPQRPPMRFVELGEQLGQNARGQFMELVEADPELFWRLAPSVRLGQDTRPFYGLISNAQGLREEREIPEEKGAREVRILFLGDSCTFGFLLQAEETFVQVAERELREAFPGTPIECINAGVPGYSLFQGWRFLETRGRSLRPDLVVLAFGCNDARNWDGLSDFDSYSAFQSVRPPGLLVHSAVARKLWSLGAEAPPADGSRPRLTPDEFRALLATCATSARSLGADVLILVNGSRMNLQPGAGRGLLGDYQQQEYEFARTLQLGAAGDPALVDGVAVAVDLSRTLPADEVYLDQVHPSARLDDALGKALAARITPWLRGRGAD